MKRRHNDAGFVGGAEVLPFGLLIFVAGTLIVVNAWSVIDTKMALDSAAQVVSRSISEGESFDEGRTRALAESTIDDLGLDSSELRVEASQDTSELVRCDRVTVTLSYPVPALLLPGLGRIGETIDVATTTSELVDPYRSSDNLAAGGCP